MKIFDTYRDICAKIEIHYISIEALETEEYYLKKKMINPPVDIKAVSYGITGGSKDHTSLDSLVVKLNKIQEKINNEKELVLELVEKKESIKDRIQKLKGIHYRVACLREFEGKSLAEISKELGKDYNYIKNISSQIKVSKL